MSVTIDISDEKLREAEEILNMHDPSQLFLSLPEEKLAQRLRSIAGSLDSEWVASKSSDSPRDS